MLSANFTRCSDQDKSQSDQITSESSWPLKARLSDLFSVNLVQGKCWFLAPLCSAYTNKRAASLLLLFRSECNEGMNSETEAQKSAELSFSNSFGAASSIQPAQEARDVPLSPATFWNADTVQEPTQAEGPVGGSGNTLVS